MLINVFVTCSKFNKRVSALPGALPDNNLMKESCLELANSLNDPVLYDEHDHRHEPALNGCATCK